MGIVLSPECYKSTAVKKRTLCELVEQEIPALVWERESPLHRIKQKGRRCTDMMSLGAGTYEVSGSDQSCCS